MSISHEEAQERISHMEITMDIDTVMKLCMVGEEFLIVHQLVHPDPTCGGLVAARSLLEDVKALVSLQAEILLSGLDVEGMPNVMDELGDL